MPGLKDLPHGLFGDGFGVKPGDLDSAFALPMTTIPQGAIIPDKIGLPFTNKTGLTLTAGTLVYQSGWDLATNRPSVTKAASTTLAAAARWIVLADTLNNAQGTLGQHYTLTGQNTNVANGGGATAVGDPVYLNSTAGTFTLTLPPAVAVQYQIVGTISVKSATVGVIEFRMLANAAEVPLEELMIAWPTIPVTTGALESCPIRMDRAGTILGISLSFTAALAAHDTNFISWSANNRSQALSLTADNTGGRNTTKITGGAAVAQYTGYPLTISLTPSNMIAAAGDVITVTSTVSGTLSNAITGTVRLIHAPA